MEVWRTILAHQNLLVEDWRRDPQWEGDVISTSLTPEGMLVRTRRSLSWLPEKLAGPDGREMPIAQKLCLGVSVVER